MSWLKKVFTKEKVTPKVIPGVSEGSPSSLSQGLQKTRQSWLQGIASLLLGKKELNPLLLEELETHLLAADVGVETTQQLIDPLVQSFARKELQDGDLVLATLKQHLIQYLEPVCQPLTIPSSLGAPFVILGVGVNGVGKTTTLAKLARQLQHWGEQYNIPVIAQGKGADSAAVIYDAYQSAKAKRVDILLADTAGRLHTQDHLMNELKKIKRVLEKISADLPQETLLVLDAGIGQNALRQAQQFNDAIGVTGLVITKLDGTAKGGIVFSLSKALSIPLRYIGIGESIADLHPFAAKDFVEAIFT